MWGVALRFEPKSCRGCSEGHKVDLSEDCNTYNHFYRLKLSKLDDNYILNSLWQWRKLSGRFGTETQLCIISIERNVSKQRPWWSTIWPDGKQKMAKNQTLRDSSLGVKCESSTVTNCGWLERWWNQQPGVFWTPASSRFFPVMAFYPLCFNPWLLHSTIWSWKSWRQLVGWWQ